MSGCNEDETRNKVSSNAWKYFGLFVVFFVIVGAAYGAAVYFGEGLDWGGLGWSETGDALSAIFGLPIAIGGTWVAILLAQKALNATEDQNEFARQQTELAKQQKVLAEKQVNFSDELDSFEKHEKAQRIANNTMEHFREVADALHSVATKAQRLDRHVLRALNRSSSLSDGNVSLVTSRNEAAAALGELSSALSRASKNKIFEAAWGEPKAGEKETQDAYLRELQTTQQKTGSDILNYYRRLQKNARNALELHNIEQAETTDEKNAGLREPSESTDGVTSRLNRKRNGTLEGKKQTLAERKNSPFGFGLLPQTLALHLKEWSDALYEAEIEELCARRKLSLYGLVIRLQATYTSDDRKTEAGQPKQFDFRKNQPYQTFLEIETIEERNNRGELYSSNDLITQKRRQVHWLWSALANLSEPHVIKPLVPAISEGQIPRTLSKEKKERAQKKYKKMRADNVLTRKGLGGDPVMLNAVGLLVASILEQIPEVISETEVKEDSDVSANDKIKTFTSKCFEGIKIHDLIPREFELAMSEFERDAALLISPLPPVHPKFEDRANHPAGEAQAISALEFQEEFIIKAGKEDA